MTRKNTSAQEFFWQPFPPVTQCAWNVHGWRGGGHFKRTDIIPTYRCSANQQLTFCLLVFGEPCSLCMALKLNVLKTQSQIQRKTVKVYKLLFLIIVSTGGGILASFVGPLQLQTDLKPLQCMAVGR